MSRFFRSIADAARGIRFVFVHEQNFRIQLGVAFLAIAAAFFFHLRLSETMVLLLLIMLVLILELINSAVEKFLDIMKPRLSDQVKIAKDIMAATVLLCALGALGIGIMIFLPHIVDFVRIL